MVVRLWVVRLAVVVRRGSKTATLFAVCAAIVEVDRFAARERNRLRRTVRRIVEG